MNEEELKNFVKFLLEANVIKIGDFTLKSGKKAPYFINTGAFDSGKKILTLGEYYAKAIVKYFGSEFDVVFGPAYKGIPLAVATVISLQQKGINKGFCFNRKEAKQYGDKGQLIGRFLDKNTRIVIVDDVITTGETKKEVINFLKEQIDDVNICGVVVLIDREEKIASGKTAVQEFEASTGVNVFSIAKITEIYKFLPNKQIIEEYLKKEGIL